MRILVLGGGRFMGLHFSAMAAEAGHDVTQFVRGKSSAPPPNGVRRILGDRDGGLDSLGSETWDAVVDTSGYVPRVVKQSCDTLRDRTSRYLFISTISVYADTTKPIDENSPRETLDVPMVEAIDGSTYGGLKALCEDVVTETFGDRALIVRPGMIVGANDPTDRFTYWVTRAAKGGMMAAIGAPESPMQYVDARDLAAWMLKAIESNLTGIYNLTGKLTTLGETLHAAKAPDTEIAYISRKEAEAVGIGPSKAFGWSVEEGSENIWNVNIDRALATGLQLRPIAETPHIG
jgi:2'-hydroxyisoflavone reductase